MVDNNKPSKNGIDIDKLYALIGDNSELKQCVDKLLIDNRELRNDIERLTAERDMLLDEVYIDPLTQVYNRGLLAKICEYDIVVVCDIDNFKGINDTYGHEAGDIVLVKIAEILSDGFRSKSGDYVIRLGGDEFVIVISNCSLNNAISRLEEIKAKITNIIYAIGIDVTMSFGISIHKDNKSLNETINEADAALYTSKGNGKNRITAFTGELERLRGNAKKVA